MRFSTSALGAITLFAQTRKPVGVLGSLKIQVISARLPQGLNRRRYIIHGRPCVPLQSVFKLEYHKLIDISYFRLVQWTGM